MGATATVILNNTLKMNFARHILLFSGVFTFLFFSNRVEGQSIIPYDFKNPDKVFLMPPVLEEISGIHLLENGTFACIQDELGIIFIFDTAKRDVVSEIRFDKDKDYEDIEVIGKDAYVLEADGDIRLVKDFLSDNISVVTYETLLSKDNDTEGLTYYPPEDALLVACKGDSWIDKENKKDNHRAVYRFPLQVKQLDEKPFLEFDVSKLMNYDSLNALARISYRLAAALDPNGDIRFQPSAIAVHPISGNLYILSFTSTMIAVFNPEGALLAARGLDKRIFQQPEGMCFDDEGTLYISNEANGGTANILKFGMKITN